MANKYGFDINNPMNWYAYERSMPNLRQGPDASAQLRMEKTLQDTQISANKMAFGEWMMTLPFTFAPTRQVVPFKPTHGALAYADSKDSRKGTSSDTPKYDAQYREHFSVRYPENYPYDNARTVDLNTPGILFPNNPLTMSPSGKTDFVMSGIVKAASLGSHIVPEPLKQILPPRWRGLLHYLSGKGTPSSLNLKAADIEQVGYETQEEQESLPSHAVNAWVKARSHEALRKVEFNPSDYVTPKDAAVGVTRKDAVKGKTGQIFPALGRFFVTPEAYVDDYRFYQITNTRAEPSYEWSTLKNALLRRQVSGTLEGILARYGKPFPVIIPRKPQ